MNGKTNRQRSNSNNNNKKRNERKKIKHTTEQKDLITYIIDFALNSSRTTENMKKSIMNQDKKRKK